MFEELIEGKIESDILVIGGGGAAVMSALRASRAGARVTLAAKGRVGKSGNTIMIGGGFSVDGKGARDVIGLADANAAYTAQSVFEKLVTSGFYLGDQKLQKLFAEKGAVAVKECLGWADAAKALFAFSPASSSWRTSGAAFGKTLKQGLKAAVDVNVVEDMVIVDVLKNGERVTGAIGFDVNTGAVVEFTAGAVILATGGFQSFSLKNSHADMTGDGIAMALRAGASVVDMEFLLFIGTIRTPRWAAGSLLPFLFTINGFFALKPKVTDLDGVELAFPPEDRFRVSPTSGKVNKLLMNAFYGTGINAKNAVHGNSFYYDYSAYSDDEIRAAFKAFAEFQSPWHRSGFYNGIDLARLADDIIANKKRLGVGFGNEYSMGGVIVDTNMATEIPGLFAAGEVTGGTFGAFRSGDGLTEMLVHGYVAGTAAAEFAKAHPRMENTGTENAVAQLLAPLGKTSGLSPIEARKSLEAICDAGFDFYRDGDRLAKAYDAIVNLGKKLDTLAIPGTDRVYNLELINAVQVRNLALCAEAGIYAALNRKESRGTHLRADYPGVNNRDFLFNYTAKWEKGALVYGKRVPQSPYIPPDSENYPSVTEFIAEKVIAPAKGGAK